MNIADFNDELVPCVVWDIPLHLHEALISACKSFLKLLGPLPYLNGSLTLLLKDYAESDRVSADRVSVFVLNFYL